jgi:hypothetical protein
MVMFDTLNGSATNDCALSTAGKTDKLMRIDLADNDFEICLCKPGINQNRSSSFGGAKVNHPATQWVMLDYSTTSGYIRRHNPLLGFMAGGRV